MYVEKGGRGLVPLRDCNGAWEEQAIAALSGLLVDGRFSRLTVEKVAPELEMYLKAADFVPTPKGLVRYRTGA